MVNRWKRSPERSSMTDAKDEKLHLKRDDVVWREVDGELVVLELSTTTYLTLNGSAKALWLCLADGATSGELARVLADRYQISAEQAMSDTDLFLSDLEERHLLHRQS